MQVQTLRAAQGRFWVATALDILGRDLGLWAGMTVVYLAMALVLRQIPYIGFLLFVWLTPIFVAGAISTARRLEEEDVHQPAFSGSRLSEGLARGFSESVAALFQVFWQPDKTLAVMIIGTAVLGGMVVLQILAQLLHIDGPALGAMVRGDVGMAIWAPAVVSVVLVWSLRLALVLVALYAVHLVMLRDETSLQALETSARALKHNLIPLTLLGLTFLVPLFVSVHYGLLVTYLAHALLLPLLLLTAFASYKDLFVRA
ncbi:MAG TPA: hypothetical protein VFN52_00290 [Acidiferrobacteraceae bacterium]|nr:hypothetical protein [Acidiferrobacteraceae bacterium]